MFWPFRYKGESSYWLKVFAYYALAELVVQLIFFFIFNTFTPNTGSNIEYHLLMVIFHCVLIWPIWWVARLVQNQAVAVQIIVNFIFAILYGYVWLVPVQDMFAVVYNSILDVTQPEIIHVDNTIDSKLHYSILNYQILKHAFRLLWYYLADYFYNYRSEEKQRIELAVSNRELQLKLLKWHLNPEFYFKTISYLKMEAAERPANAGKPILQLAKVMEYVIYDARQARVHMSKEAQFLSNYIQLQNEQLPAGCKILFTYEKTENQLLITPLLLAGLVEGIATTEKEKATENISIAINFTGNQLLLAVKGIHTPPVHQPLLDELYAGKYTAGFTKHDGYKLTIHLDAA